jgi:hypothetical protein
MATGKKSFTAYCDWLDIFEELTNEEAGKLIKHLLRYVNDQNPEAPDRVTKLTFTPIKLTLKRDLKKWEEKREKNRESALKRWNKKDANACERIKRNANDAVSVSVSDSDINNINITDNVFEELRKRALKENTIEQVKLLGIQKRFKINSNGIYNTIREFVEHLKTEDIVHLTPGEMLKHYARWMNKINDAGKLDKYKQRAKGDL